MSVSSFLRARGAQHFALASLLGFTLLVAAALGPSLVDDGFIYARIAEHLVSGQGWSYNVGTAANAATAPLYVLVLAVTCMLSHDGTAAVQLAYGSGLCLSALAGYLAWRPHGSGAAWLGGFAAACSGIVLRSAGLETSWFLGCVLLTGVAYRSSGDSLRTGVLAGLVALLRPEGVALIPMLLTAEWVTRRRVGLRMLAATALLVVPWLLFSRLEFGSFLPSTIGVKAAQSRTGIVCHQPAFAWAFLQQMSRPWLTLPLVVWGVLSARRSGLLHDVALALPIAFGLLQLAAYQVLRAPVGYFWYFAPANLSLDYLLLGASVDLGRRLYRAVEVRSRACWALAAVDQTALGLAALLLLSIAPPRPPGPYRLAATYRALGNWIRRHSSDTDRVASVEIGYLGFFSQREIRDVHGLIHPHALARLEHNERDWWLRTEPPELVVLHDPPWDWEPFHSDFPAPARAQFLAEYEPIHSVACEKGAGELVVYRRHAAAVSSAAPRFSE